MGMSFVLFIFNLKQIEIASDKFLFHLTVSLSNLQNLFCHFCDAKSKHHKSDKTYIA